MYLATLYKARSVPTKSPVCAICVERTRGKTVRVELGYGVSVNLCAGHADPEFQERRNGRDFVLTLMRLWQAHGCMTQSRHKALAAHEARMRTPKPSRPLPGSYAWPELRRRAERAYAAGHHPTLVATRLRAHLEGCPAHPPSPRTFQRWHAQRRWLRAAHSIASAPP